ncbi:hypothetical protein F5877DRAFT_72596 [Lentinula edodes]|nr:hypothetical protein F5877DRAFT_72596 [Lentinula edodes]
MDNIVLMDAACYKHMVLMFSDYGWAIIRIATNWALAAAFRHGTNKQVYAIFNKNKKILGIAFGFILSRFILDILDIPLSFGASATGTPFHSFSRCGIEVTNANEFDQQWLCTDLYSFIYQVVKHILIHKVFLDYIKAGNHNTMRFFTDLFYRLPNLFISHLVLNLRIFSRPGNTVISQRTKTSVSSLNFASSQMLGNIGAPLDGTSFAEKEDEEEENGAEIEMEAIEEHSEANEN